MSTNERIQADVQQAKDKVSDAKGFIETERAKDKSTFSGVSAEHVSP